MKVISTNIAEPTTILWRGKDVRTGIFKYPTNNSIYLDKEDVRDDTVIDRKHHGGIDKACYLFSADYYDYWKDLYSELDWNWGMFGENITIEGLNENKINIGDVLKIGDAVVQVSQPRQPCFKLGVRFENQKVLKDFISFAHPGTYVRVLQEGIVKPNDKIIKLETGTRDLTVYKVFQMIYNDANVADLVKAIKSDHLAQSCKKHLSKKLVQSI